MATAIALLLPAARSTAEDVSAPAILQWFDGTWWTMERRAADVFQAGYGAIWAPPPGRAESSNFSVGYDVYDRFDLGKPGDPTLYGTESGIKSAINTLHKAGVDFHIDFVINHNGFADAGTPGFIESGGYPGFILQNPDGGGDPWGVPNTDGDFNSSFDWGAVRERLAGLIDINHASNWQLIRHPVDPDDPRNIPAGITPWNGRLANQPDPNNARFYPDRDLQPIMVFDPKTGESDIAIYPFNLDNPMAGDPIPENATGLLMRNAQWLVQVIGVDGFRIDAAKHIEGFTLDYFDRAVYRANPRKLLDGSTQHVFSYSEVFDGNRDYLSDFIRKDINPNDPGRVGGNRDVLDFPAFFAMRDNLTSNGFTNNWYNMVYAGMDVHDDGLRNGSAGVLFVGNHDEGPGPYLNNVAHAYVLMQPGNAVVYFNGKEHGDNREFPKDGRGDALGGRYGDTIINLVNIRNTHGRGDYRERWISKEYYAFERSGSALVLLSNRNDGGTSDWINFFVDLPWGTPLIELTGNAKANGLPELLTVTSDGWEQPNYVRTKFLHNDDQDKGFLIYGLATPQGQLTLSNVAQAIGPDAETSWNNGSQRLSEIDVITADSFGVTLTTNAVNLLGVVRDRDADGDNALIRIDGGLDLNGNGYVDFVTPGSVVYGFEEFVGANASKSPGYFNADGNGLYTMQIDASQLSEGYHFIEVRAFRHREDGGPAVYAPFKRTIYVDRLPPESAIDQFRPFGSFAGDNDIWIRSVDQTADSVHVFMNLPATVSDEQILQMVANGQGRADAIDRDIFKTGFFGIPNGNNVFTIVTFEITGNLSIQRFTGITPANVRGGGLGDLNHNGVFEPGDLANTSHGFEAVLYSRNAQFNPAADLNGDGLVDNRDLFLLKNVLVSNGAGTETLDMLNQVLLRRGNINGAFGTDQWDIDALYDRVYGRVASTDLWYDDLNVDGVIDQLDVDALVYHILQTNYGDANLDRVVNRADLDILLASYTQPTGWAGGNFTGLGPVGLADLELLLSNYTGPTGLIDDLPQLGQAERTLLTSYGFTVVPEPAGASLATAVGVLLLSRRRRRSPYPSRFGRN